jgi:hypothetical protein
MHPVYPTLASKLGRRLRDVPPMLAAWRDQVWPGRFGRMYRAVQPYTMSRYARLRGLYRGIQAISEDGVPGDVVECGTARGGSAALLALALRDLQDARRVWAFDTFEGLPPPTANDPDYDTAVQHVGTCRGELDQVAGLMARLGVGDRVTLVKGLFQDTLPGIELPSIALLHLDGDWYDSVKFCLDRLYDQVSPGGVIQIDDFGYWEGARKATLDFFRERGLEVRLVYLDYTGRQFRKPLTLGRR